MLRAVAANVGGPSSPNVVGPATSTDNALVRFDGATGKIIQNSLGILSDTGLLALSGAGNAIQLGTAFSESIVGAGIATAGPTFDVSVYYNSGRQAAFNGGNLYLLADTAGLILGASSDTILLRDAANTLAMRNGVTAQTLRLYGTYGGGGTDFERLNISMATGGSVDIFPSAGGTGASRQLAFGVAGATQWAVYTTAAFGPLTDNARDLGFSAGRVRDAYIARDLFRIGGTQAAWRTSTAITSGAGAQAGTLLNSPTAGNPTCWIPINDNGTTRYIPAW